MFSLRDALTGGAAVLGVVLLLGGQSPPAALRPPQASDAYFVRGEAELAAKLAQQPNFNRAKNVILFIGDGMGISTVTAARIYSGEKRGVDGVANRLAMETLPYAALSRTYAHDAQVTDSAPSATALTTGVKTVNDVIGLNHNAIAGRCDSATGSELLTIFEMAEMAGLATGIVTTTRITHATPAAAYAHTPFRDWEADSDMREEDRHAGCIDIAAQLVGWPYGDGFEVILGGGRQKLMPETAADPEYADVRGERSDGRDLIAEWLARRPGGVFVWNRAGFDGADPARTARLLGLFEPSDMRYEADRSKDPGGEPSLSEMTAKAIAILKQRDDGFLLMVEGGRIDHAHHAGNAARALEETLAFDEAIATAFAMTDPADTLIVVTADHSHTLTIGGYPKRDNPILGLSVGVDGRLALARDGKPYTTLSYANGPGAVAREREDLRGVDTTDIDFRQQTLVPLLGETHGGEDVAIFAGGPFAHLFRGVVDQQFIYHVIAHASQIPARARGR